MLEYTCLVLNSWDKTDKINHQWVKVAEYVTS